MNALRQFVDVKNNSFNVLLPEDFKASRVEIIIMSSDISEIPQWQKNEAIKRLEIYKTYPETVLDFDKAMDQIENDLLNVKK